MCYRVTTASTYTSAGPLSQVKRCFHICLHIGLHRLPIGHFAHIGNGAELLLFIFDARPAACTQGKHTNSGKSGTGAHYVNCTSVEDYDYGDDPTEPQMPIKQTKIHGTEEGEILDDVDDE